MFRISPDDTGSPGIVAMSIRDSQELAALLRDAADKLDTGPILCEPTDATVIVDLYMIDFDRATRGSPVANLALLLAMEERPDVRLVLATRGIWLSTNGRGRVNEISALAGVRRIVEDYGAAGLDVTLDPSRRHLAPRQAASRETRHECQAPRQGPSLFVVLSHGLI